MVTDREVLLAAQARARQVLTDSAKRAADLLARSSKDAAADLVREQELAQELLLQEIDQALLIAGSDRRTAEQLPEAESADYAEHRRLTAESLRLTHERTAAELSKVEKALAAKVGEAAAEAAVDLLMDGHREAAGILLEARMSVTDRR